MDFRSQHNGVTDAVYCRTFAAVVFTCGVNRRNHLNIVHRDRPRITREPTTHKNSTVNHHARSRCAYSWTSLGQQRRPTQIKHTYYEVNSAQQLASDRHTG